MTRVTRPISIPEPTNDVDSLWKTAQVLKEAVEVLQGIRGNRAALTLEDLNSILANVQVAATEAGADGQAVAELLIYQRAASQPATPTGGSFTFGSPPSFIEPVGWFNSIPAGTDPVWVSAGVASIFGAEGTDTDIAWSTPVIGFENGLDGQSVDIIFVRSAVQPATPSPSLGTPAGWYTDVDSVPPSDDILWASIGTRPDATSNYTWQTPVQVEGQNGITGTDGNSVFYATTYIRAASQPSAPTGGEFDFDTDTLTPPVGWNASPPTANGDPLWASTATFSINGTSGTATNPTWSTPTQVVIDGTDGSPGANGLSVYVANIYRRSAVGLSAPTGGQYDFGTNELTAPTDWSIAPPPSDGNPLYVSTGSFEVEGSTGIDTTTTWSSPDILVVDGDDGGQGPSGDDGLSVHVSNVYIRASSTPATPSDGQYDFSSRTLTPPSGGWAVSPPASNGNPLYVSTTTWSVQGTTGIDNTPNWTAPDLLVQDGADGDPGDPGENAVYITYDNSALTVPVSSAGTPDWTASGGVCQVFDGDTALTLHQNTRSNSPPPVGQNGRYNLGLTFVSGDGNVTRPNLTGENTTTATLADWSGSSLTGVTVFRLIANIRRSDGTTLTREVRVSIAPANEGADGTPGGSEIGIGDLPDEFFCADLNLDTTSAQAIFRVTSLGAAQKGEGLSPSYTTLATYTEAGASGSDYEVLFVDDPSTISVGGGGGSSSNPALSVGNLGTWQVVSTSRSIGISQTSSGSKQGKWLVKFRRASDKVNLAEVPVYLYAERQ